MKKHLWIISGGRSAPLCGTRGAKDLTTWTELATCRRCLESWRLNTEWYKNQLRWDDMYAYVGTVRNYDKKLYESCGLAQEDILEFYVEVTILNRTFRRRWITDDWETAYDLTLPSLMWQLDRDIIRSFKR